MRQIEPNVNTLVDHLFRKEYGRLVSYLAYLLGQEMMDHAEDIAQDALETAFKTWRDVGIPDNPSAWLFTIARNKTYNLIKRRKKYASLMTNSFFSPSPEIMVDVRLQNEINDSVLRMFFACCSPQISFENQVVLILNTLCGFSRSEISQAMLAEEEALKKRLFRLKKDIRVRKIPLSVPVGKALKPRLNAINNALYLLFNKGYNSYLGQNTILKEICLEAMRLCKLIIQHFPSESDTKALLALMCFHSARFDSRVDSQGGIVLLEDQDRKTWNQELIDLGHYYLSEAVNEETTLSCYHLEANIAAVHCSSESMRETDWQKISKLYHWLYLHKPSPVIRLNLAIIESELSGPARSIEYLNLLEKEEKQLTKYYLFYASRGHFYLSLGHHELGAQDLLRALELTSSEAEIRLIKNKLDRIPKTRD